MLSWLLCVAILDEVVVEVATPLHQALRRLHHLSWTVIHGRIRQHEVGAVRSVEHLLVLLLLVKC